MTTATTSLERFQDLLRSLFQFDFADLDFGMYRLFKLRHDHIEAFLMEDLPRLVDEAFGTVATGVQAGQQTELEALRSEITTEMNEETILPDGSLNPDHLNFRFLKERAARYNALRTAVQETATAEAQHAEVFHHLYTFFSRYYEDADFLPRRRYGATETYAAPYDGQEVLFHWPTRGMHYIKSGEHFRDYTFTLATMGGELRIRFTLTDADLPRDNTKGDTRFFFPLPAHVTYDTAAHTVTVPFHYRPATDAEGKPKQDDLLAEALGALLKAIEHESGFPAPQLAEPDERGTPFLLKRLRHFTRRNTTDYFLHPDLSAFLHRELDFYLKDQVVHLDDLAGDFARRLRLVRVVRAVAGQIIAFLDGIEQVQVRLFRKPKLVLQTDYLVPLRHVPEALWDEILAEPKQRAAWQHLFGTPDAPDADFLRSHPTLVLDTQHFSADFRVRLLEALHDTLGNLDEATDGLLLHGENYQALTLLQKRYAGHIKCIYIDPPYNTGGDGFIYKDRYQHSSWLTMMEERLQQARQLLPGDGVLFASIDDDEQARLKALGNLTFGAENFVTTLIWQKKYAPANDAKWFSDDHDYVLTYAMDRDQWHPERLPRTEKQNKAYTNPDKDKRGRWKTGDYTSNKSSDERPHLYYPIINPNTEEEIYPSIKRVWAYNAEQHEKNVKENRVWWGLDGKNSVPAYKRFLSEVGGLVPKTIMPWKEVGHNQDAVRELQKQFSRSPFSSPKPTKLLNRLLQVSTGDTLDFFAGSGTTGDAVIRYNRQNGTRRRFILAEMGEHFDTVLLPRIQKVMYAPAWKDGLPKTDPAFAPETEDILDEATGEIIEKRPVPLPDWVTHTPRLVRVLRIESYDDALHNLTVAAENPATRQRAQAIEALTGAARYRLRYLFSLALDHAQTLLAPRLTAPFDYHLATLTEDGETLHPVDLVETANLLLGLRVARYEHRTFLQRRYLLVHATGPAGKRTLCIWRDTTTPAPLDFHAERADLEPLLNAYDHIYVNDDSALPGAASIDPVLHAALAPEHASLA